MQVAGQAEEGGGSELRPRPALRQAIGAAAADVVLERSRSADRNAGALADLSRRLEAIERQLAGTSDA